MNVILEGNNFRDIFGTDLVMPQNIIFNSMMNLDYAAFRLSRGGGKDFLLATYAMLYATSVAESHISIVAPVYKQAKIPFEVINRFSLKSAYFKDLYSEKPITGCNICYLEFKNKSIIEATPFCDDIFTYNGNIILVTEADSMPEQHLLKLIKGVENNTLRKVFLMSAGYYNYNYMNKIEAHGYFSTFAFGYKAFPTGFYDQTSIDNIKETLSIDIFNMEYNSKICKYVAKNERRE